MRISGPISVHVFDLAAEQHRVILFGDRHFSYKHQCDRCVAPECQDVVQFMGDYAERVASWEGDRGWFHKSLDLFFELPYATRRNATSVRKMTAWQSRLNAGGAADGSDGSDGMIGMLGYMFHRFEPYLYDDESKVGSSAVRFHYSDIRHEPNVAKLMSENMFGSSGLISSVARLRQLLDAMIFAPDFYEAIMRMRIPGVRALVEDDAISEYGGRRVHKIAKQFLKLPAKWRGVVRRYLEDRIVAEGKVLSEHGVFKKKLAPFDNRVKDVIEFGVPLLLQDAYMLCRSLHYIERSRDGTTMMYVGDLHAEKLVEFFADYANRPASVSQKRSASFKRCVNMIQGPGIG